MAKTLNYPLVDADHIRERLRAAMRDLRFSQNALARRIGITNGHLSRVLSGEKEPGEKVAGWLGYNVVTRYQHQPRPRRVQIGEFPL